MNIYDIAKEAKVSISTVSRVLNNKPNVRRKTREKVEAVLARYNYRPNAIARGLALKRTRMVGVLTTDVRVSHYAATAYSIERELYNMGYSVILCNTGGEADNSYDYIRILLENGVSGVILIGSVFQNKYIESSIIGSFKDLPFVIVNSQLHADNVYSVMIDHKSGISLCFDHLLSKNRNQIIYIQDAESFSGKYKAVYFFDKARQTGVYTNNKQVIKTERGITGGKEAVNQLIASGQDFNAIIFGDDLTAVGGLFRLQELGYRVPEDVAVIGWNNAVCSTACNPNLTTVDNKTELIGRLSAKVMESLINDKQVSRSLYVESDLIIRAST